MSYFVISDGKTFKHFGSAQDHKEFWRETKVKTWRHGMLLPF